jgi:hypothetical protein
MYIKAGDDKRKTRLPQQSQEFKFKISSLDGGLGGVFMDLSTSGRYSSFNGSLKQQSTFLWSSR